MEKFIVSHCERIDMAFIYIHFTNTKDINWIIPSLNNLLLFRIITMDLVVNGIGIIGLVAIETAHISMNNFVLFVVPTETNQLWMLFIVVYELMKLDFICVRRFFSFQLSHIAITAHSYAKAMQTT